MACGTFTIKKVPAQKVQQTMDLFKANQPPPTSVTSKDNGDGTFIVTAVFPPCPANTTHSAAGST
jgi:hypothetical protein